MLLVGGQSGAARMENRVCMCAKSLQSRPASCDLWTRVHQAPLSMGFFRHEYWSGLPFPSPGGHWLEDSLPLSLFTTEPQPVLMLF